jgi:hypothetical protein
MLTKTTKRPICVECRVRPARSCGKSVQGFPKWRKYCSSCDSKKYRKQLQKNSTCETCGFIAKHSCQLDLVRISGKYKTYCSNCNRLRIQNLKQKAHDEYELTVDATVDLNEITI